MHFESTGNLPIIPPEVMHLPEAFNIFNDMKKTKDMGAGKSAYLSSKLWELFALLIEKENKEKKTDYVEKALSIIHSEYTNPLTVEKIAKTLNLDRSYLSTIFKKKIGISPKQYLLNYRMSIASTLMKEQGASVSLAAKSVGYTDIFNFSKMFKKHFGMSPNNYVKSKL